MAPASAAFAVSASARAAANDRRPRADQLGNPPGIDAAAAGLEGVGRDRFRQGDIAERQRFLRPRAERIDAIIAQVEPILGRALQLLEDGAGGGRPLSLGEPDRRVAPAGVPGVDRPLHRANFRGLVAILARFAQHGGVNRLVERRLLRTLRLAGHGRRLDFGRLDFGGLGRWRIGSGWISPCRVGLWRGRRRRDGGRRGRYGAGRIKRDFFLRDDWRDDWRDALRPAAAGRRQQSGGCERRRP